MKLNEKELASYAQSANGKADKEGILWIKEYDGKSKKREVLTRRWFKLIGNLLFYFKSDVQSSPVFGLIILLKSYVEADKENSEVKYSFKLTFEQDATTLYQLAAENPQDMVEWMLAIRSVGYEYLLDAASELRAKIFHLTSKDPIPKGNPLSHRHLRAINELPPTVTTFPHDDPLLNLSLGCSSLVSPRKRLPSPLIVTNVRTPPQAYWTKLAQTEIVENECDPHFFTVVLLTSGSTLTTTELRFEVFDVEDRSRTKMHPIGVAHCTVKDILQSSGYQTRLQIFQGQAIQGYLSVLAWRESQSPTVLSPTSPETTETSFTCSGQQTWRQASKSASLKLPFNRLIMTNFQFPVSKEADESGKKILKVSEVMGEGIYSWSIPRQMLDIFINDDNQYLRHYQSLKVLKEDWEISRQEVMYEHSEMIAYYRSELSCMEQEQAKGFTFKKSTEKGAAGYEFIPTNLHVQYLRVEEGTKYPPVIAYEVVTVGAPTAYGLKSRIGGLMRWNLVTPFSMANHYSDTPSHENPTSRAKILLVHMDQCLKLIHEHAQNLLE
jgi:inositol polyphosphate-4-phosphatase